MTKRFPFLTIALATLCAICMAPIRVVAQDKPAKDAPVILVTTAEDAAVILTVTIPEDGSGVWVETAPGQIQKVEGAPGILVGEKYWVSGSKVKIYGATKTFACSQNEGNIKEIDCSGNKHLEAIFCSENKLQKLNVSGCVNLKNIQCYKNELTELDTRGMKDLNMIDASMNQIATLDLSESSQLTNLEVCVNAITDLKLTSMPQLQKFDIGDNEIVGKLDLSASTALALCNAEENKLTEVRLPESDKLSVIYLAKNEMDDCALNKLYQQLNSVQTRKKIEVVNNPGVVTSNTKIAKDKGWEIDVEGDGTGCPNGGSDIAVQEVSRPALVVFGNAQSGNIYVQNAEPHSVVKVYNMVAELLLSTTTDAEGKAVVSGSRLAHGTYLIVTGTQNTLFTWSK